MTVEEICTKHFLGFSKPVSGSEKFTYWIIRYHNGCIGCKCDEFNKNCPGYRPMKRYSLDIEK